MDMKDLLLLFERPNEPIFMPRGKKQTVFVVPASYLTDQYQKVAADIEKFHLGTSAPKVSVKEMDSKPDLSLIMQLSRNENFSVFLPKHQQAAEKLIDAFMTAKSIEDLLSAACYSRDRVNPQLFNYALSVALIHRSETRDMSLPLFPTIFPDQFMDPQVLNQVREEASVLTETSRRPIEIP